MGLGDCPNCWNKSCTCEDGHGWMGYSVQNLKEIQAAIKAALKRKRKEGR